MAEKMPRKEYERELARLHLELVKLQYWIKQSGERVVLLATHNLLKLHRHALAAA